jgi:hypothetical protein
MNAVLAAGVPAQQPLELRHAIENDRTLRPTRKLDAEMPRLISLPHNARLRDG